MPGWLGFQPAVVARDYRRRHFDNPSRDLADLADDEDEDDDEDAEPPEAFAELNPPLVLRHRIPRAER
jgi:hypothetical protein